VTSKPRQPLSLGMSLGDTRVLPRWGPAYRQHDLDLGSRLERAKARPETATGLPGWGGRTLSGRNRKGRSTGVGALADSPVVAVIRLRIAVGRGAKGRGRPG
jgi:hypothetical protein